MASSATAKLPLRRPSVSQEPPKEKPVLKAVRNVLEIRPQPGPQEVFLTSEADIAIYGGAAFAGKTFGLLMECLRIKDVPGSSAVVFRRTLKQATNPGGLWDESCGLFGSFGAEPSVGRMEHRFPYSGAIVKFAGMEHPNDRFDWDGAQIPLLCFDQLEHFEWVQFWYMLSRNRDPSGQVRPYLRATCNPDPDSWLATFISWWIDPVSGFPIPERAGVLRWFVRGADDSPIWADSREELEEEYGEDCGPLSVTFIPGTIYDNQIGMQRDPGYESKLKNMGRVERERLLGGNWKIRSAAGLLFRREWCTFLDEPPRPEELEAVVRAWDLAATEKREDNDPAFTAGVKMGRYRHSGRHGERNRWVILHVKRGQWRPSKVEATLLTTAKEDGKHVRVRGPQDPGQAGKDQAQRLVSLLAGFDARFRPETGDKETRFNPVSAQAEHGNIDIVRGDWNDDFLRVLESFPDGKIKDDADACSAAFDELLRYGVIDLDAALDRDSGSEVMNSDGSAPWSGMR